MKNNMKKGLLIYSLIWFITVGAFWLGMSREAMGYSLLAFYLILPIAGLVCSAMSGARSGLRGIIFCSLFIGVMYMMSQYLTFSLLNMLKSSITKINYPSIPMLIGGALTAFIGYFLGVIFRRR